MAGAYYNRPQYTQNTIGPEGEAMNALDQLVVAALEDILDKIKSADNEHRRLESLELPRTSHAHHFISAGLHEAHRIVGDAILAIPAAKGGNL
jgi:hypothetical protein